MYFESGIELEIAQSQTHLKCLFFNVLIGCRKKKWNTVNISLKIFFFHLTE